MTPLLHSVTRKQIDGVITRPKGAYIFIGPRGIGKRTTTVWLARQLHCQAQADCQACNLTTAGNHPDFVTVKPEEKQSIGIAQIQALQHILGLSIQDSMGYRIVLIEQAESLTHEAQNCLLKTIEEPPARTLIVLAVTEPLSLLPTVRSRCQQVGFLPLPKAEIEGLLESKLKLSPDAAARLASIAGGAPGFAVMLAENSSNDFSPLAQEIASMPDKPKFERLIVAAKLAESSLDLKLLNLVLKNQARAWLSEASRLDQRELTAALKRTAAIEEFLQNIRANVTLKTALSGLVVQL